MLHNEDKSTIEPNHSGSHVEPRTAGTIHGADTGLSSHGSYTTSHNYALDHDNRGSDGPASKTDGPHRSNLLNKLDPRVDSDREGSCNMDFDPQGTSTTRDEPGHTVQGHGTTGAAIGTGAAAAGHHKAGHGTYGTTGANRGHDGPATRTDGPYESNVANKTDPRVDSDRDHSRNLGANPEGSATTRDTGAHDRTTGGDAFFTGSDAAPLGTTGAHGTTATHGSDIKGAPEGAYGPHGNRVTNAADPRVDSDRDGSKTVGGDNSETQA